MVIKVTTSNTQAAKAAIQKALKNFSDSGFLTVGIHEDTGNHEGGDITNAALGATLHYGNENIPARPWLDLGVESGEKAYASTILQAAKSGDTLEEALNQVGDIAAAQVQIFMTELKTPPNADSTKQRKGSSNPLIHTGALRQSVTFKTQIKKPAEGL